MKKKICQVTKRYVEEYEITNQDILSALLVAGKLKVAPGCKFEIYFRVPGGGDRSNQAVEIDAEHPVCIKVTSEVKEDIA